MRIREVRESGSQSEQVEVVVDELSVDFTEELMVVQVTEPGNPTSFRVVRLFSFGHVYI